jgi:hypothetical protein
MKVKPTDKRPCNLKRGEVRRVSQDVRFPLVGYHVCCPRCGFVSVAFQNQDGMIITEGATSEALTFSQPLTCIYCAILIYIVDGDVRLEANGNERHLVFR